MKQNFIFITAENTGVGKTFVACSLIEALKKNGHRVSARKPLESYEQGEIRDSELLSASSCEDVDSVTDPKWRYDIPMAPPMAAGILRRYVPSTREVAETLSSYANGTCVTLVEGAGGLYSPLTSDGNSLSLAELIHPKIFILVIKSQLGAINNTLLSLRSLAGKNVVVYLNYHDNKNILHAENLQFLEDVVGDKNILPENFEKIQFASDINTLRDLCEKELSCSHL